MNYRKLGNTNLILSEITFGAWAAGGWMWGGTDKKAAVEAIKAAYDNGVTSIDTAPIYGQGLSEEIVGEAISKIPREKIQILTKYGMKWDDNKGYFKFKSQNNDGKPIDVYSYASKKSIIKECDDSLHRLKTDYIDLYQIHWPDPTTPMEETMEAITKLIEQGKVRYAGVCNYNAQLMKEASKYIDLASDQVPYSMVTRDIEQELIPYCIEHGKAVIAYSPLQRGLLTGKITPNHQFATGDHRPSTKQFSRQNIINTNAFLEKIKPIAAEKHATLGQLVLRWTLEQPGITIALAGARNKNQAIQNALASDIQITEDEMTFINNELGQLKLVD